MLKKVIIWSILLACLIVSVWGIKCPRRWSRPSTNEGKRCWVTSSCSSGQYCCRSGWFGRKCRYPVKPPTSAISGSSSNVDADTSSTISRKTSSTLSRSSQEAIHSGSCDRARRVRCGGTSCTGDGQCSSNQKCCQNRCGQLTCVAALRSSSSIFAGRK